MAKLEYYLGRPVSRMHRPKKNQDQSKWMIELYGGVLIKNQDEARVEIPNLESTALLDVEYADDATTMVFGQSTTEEAIITDRISLTPPLYSIADNEYTGGVEVWPQAEKPVEIALPDHPDERIADGPSEEWLTEQARLTEEQAAFDAARAAESDSKATK